MGRYIISPEDQLLRLNKMREEIASLQNLNRELLIKRPRPKSWCVAEIVEHMSLGHYDYKKKINQALDKLPASTETTDHIKTKAIPSFLIKGFPPKDGKIRFKMKTFKKFVPVFNEKSIDEKGLTEIFDRFTNSLDHLNDTVSDYRKKEVDRLRFPSAVGAWVRFNVAEACEFIICHNERHLQQIRNTLKSLK